MRWAPKCDCCGKFMRVGAPGTSWVNVPDCPPMGIGDERDRCAKCTTEHGPALCSPSYVRELCCGVVPKDKPNEWQLFLQIRAEIEGRP